MRVVCLVSGGVDSTVMLHVLSERNEVVPLFVDYGQSGVRREKRAAAAACAPLHLRLAVVSVRGLRAGRDAGDRKAAGGPQGSAAPGAPPPSPYFPKRNMLLLSAAAAFARLSSCRVVAIGVIGGTGYGDQSERFVRSAEAALSADGGIAVMAPFEGMSKAEVARLAKGGGVALGATYSCDRGGERHCGRCGGCRDRRAVLDEAKKA